MSDTNEWNQKWMQRSILGIHIFRLFVVISAVINLFAIRYIEHVIFHPQIISTALALIFIETLFTFLIVRSWTILSNFLVATYVFFIVIITFNSSLWSVYDFYLAYWFIPSLLELLLFLLLAGILINGLRVHSLYNQTSSTN